jgi:hypothetical protein
LLWDPIALAQLARPQEVVTLRQFAAMANSWPEDLPSNDGRAIVVVGVEGCLDAMIPDEAMEWVERDLRRHIFAFNDEYQDAAALVFWLPSGRERIRYALASNEYSWSGLADPRLPLGHALWAGARDDAHRILLGAADADPEGPGWVGMYHPRIS